MRDAVVYAPNWLGISGFSFGVKSEFSIIVIVDLSTKTEERQIHLFWIRSEPLLDEWPTKAEGLHLSYYYPSKQFRCFKKERKFGIIINNL